MKKNFLINFLLIYSFSTYGQNLFPELNSSVKECITDQNSYEDIWSLSDSADYGMRVIPDKKGTSSSGKDTPFVFTENGKNNYYSDSITEMMGLVTIPGNYDPVPTPDGEFMVIPAKGDTIQFFDEVNNLSETSEPIYDDMKSGKPLMGTKQSLAIVNKEASDSGKLITYLAITDTVTLKSDQKKLEMKEYTFKIGADGKKEFVSASNEVKSMCDNLDVTAFKTPTLSPDGKMLSAYNSETGTTIIYNITPSNNGNYQCEKKLDLGFATTPVEFSPDGEKLLFSMNSLSTSPEQVDWNKQPAKTQNLNVYTYDMKSDQLQRLTNTLDGNSYSPTFSSNGKEVFFLNQYFSRENNSTDASYSVKMVNLEKAPRMKKVDFSLTSNCELVDPSLMKLMALGKLWESVCSRYTQPMTMAAIGTLPLSLNSESCSNLVINYWDMYLARNQKEKLTLGLDKGTNSEEFSTTDQEFYMKSFLGISKPDLLKTCETLNKKEQKEQKKPVKKIFKKKPVNNPDVMLSCKMCHGPNTYAPYIPFEKGSEKLAAYKSKLILQVMTGNMPKDMPMSAEEREAVLEWIDQIPDEPKK